MSKSRLWTVGTAVLVVAILAIGWFLLISPKRSDASSLKTTAADTEAQNMTTEAQIRQLKLEQKQLPAQRAQIEAIKVQMPNAPEQPALIRQLTADASRSDVELKTITPAAMQPVAGTTGVAYMPLTIAFTGTYANVKTFLDSLEEDKRSIMVTDMNVSVSTDDAELLTVNLTARAFVSSQQPAAGSASTSSGSTGSSTTGGSTTGSSTTGGSTTGSTSGGSTTNSTNAN